ncbi:MAG: hypothetical protein ABJM11_10160 [Marinobacter sp.]|uniref:hypothetical protein n=1 Tax=Marinobacter sp. TaxID=50741 RepID=UPI0029BE0E2F|nr:hypothetical protein [Marinobacter sp.]
MKTIIALTLAGSMISAPAAMAKGSFQDAERILQAGSDYGITQFRSIEFDEDDDDYDDIELEGWVDSDWYVELDMKDDGSVGREQRRKHDGEVYGLSADDVRDYLKAAQAEGMDKLEEFKVSSSGNIEVEGDDSSGREVEVDFRLGDLTPVKVQRDD